MNKMKKVQSVRRNLVIIAGILSVLAIGTIWAYYQSEGSIDNKLHTKMYGGEQLVEKFTPDGDWELGERVTKEVMVENTGKVELFVRIKLSEKWLRGDYEIISLDSRESVPFGSNYNFINGTGQSHPSDGLTSGDGSVVAKKLGSARWVCNPIDGYWYYNTTLKQAGMAGDTTELFLESIVLTQNADMGLFEELKYYTSLDKRPANNVISDDPAIGWTLYTGAVPELAKYSRSVSEVKEGYEGYANADYILTVTYETYQATPEAREQAVSENGGWADEYTPTLD